MRVGVVGCGTAGPAVAALLARDGHDVTLVDRFAEPRPVGAGLLIQPIGMGALQRLGVLEVVAEHASRVERLLGRTVSGRTILDLSYAEAAAGAHGLGVQRGVLFAALLQGALAAGVKLRTGLTVLAIEDGADGLPMLRASRGDACAHGGATRAGDVETLGPFDLVIVADGARSGLRPAAQVRRAREYPWAALWCVVELGTCDPHTLEQVYRDASQMIGFLPTGRAWQDGAGRETVSVFWSLPREMIAAVRSKPIEAWKSTVAELAPHSHGLLAAVTAWEQVMPATYFDVVMRPWHDARGGRVVWLGDAAHAMSPQLGMGANLALVDAVELAVCLHEHVGSGHAQAQSAGLIGGALAEFTRRRREQVRYYQWASRGLTPLFQSGNRPLAFLRDVLMPMARRIRPIRRAMLASLCGTPSLSGAVLGRSSAEPSRKIARDA